MYILYEMRNANGDFSIGNWDAMGYTLDERTALAWVQQNPNYRCYGWCPNKQVG